MDDICKKIREQIPELIGAGLSAEKAVELEQHRSQCPACNEYFEALQADDELLCEFARAMQPSVARLENIAMDELGRRQRGKTARNIPKWQQILRSRPARIAAAVLIVAAVLIGAAIFSDPGKEPVQIIKQVSEATNDEPDLDAVVAAELGQIREMFAVPDVAGLMAMLDDGQPQSKVAAANYLAQIGDAQAIGALEQLSADWKGDAADNPFARAVAQIMGKLGQQEQESRVEEEETSVADATTGEIEGEIGCQGVVVDERGRAIPDAKAYWKRPCRLLMGHLLAGRLLSSTPSSSVGTNGTGTWIPIY